LSIASVKHCLCSEFQMIKTMTAHILWQFAITSALVTYYAISKWQQQYGHWRIALRKTRYIKCIPKLWPFPNKMRAAGLGMGHSATNCDIGDHRRCMHVDGILPKPSSAKATFPCIPNVLNMLNEPCFIGCCPFAVVPIGSLIPFWVGPKTVTIGSNSQERLNLVRGDGLVVIGILIRPWTN
jgi:hypothetical protein